MGSWGRGFVLALRHWPVVERAYRHWARFEWAPVEIPRSGPASTETGVKFELGRAQFVQVSDDLWVANIIGQHRTTAAGETTPIRYDALEAGLLEVQAFCQARRATAHMPRIGAGLARGSWERIAAIIDRTLVERGVPTTVYDLV
jgi:hypothetical protein